MLGFVAQINIEHIEEMVDVTSVTPWDLVWAVVTLIAGAAFGHLARAAVRRYGRRVKMAPNMIDLAGTIALWSIVSISIFVALAFVGFTLAPLWIGIALVALIFIIGGRTLLENFGAGVLLQARAPFEPGEQVRLGEFVGVVQEVNSRVVVMDTIDNKQVFMPNIEVLAAPIVNLTHTPTRMSMLNFSLVYGTDIDHAKRTILDAVNAQEQVLDDPPPVVEVHTFEDSAIGFVLRFWHASDLLSEWAATDAAASASYKALERDKIYFAFPQRTLWWGGTEAESQDGPLGSS